MNPRSCPLPNRPPRVDGYSIPAHSYRLGDGVTIQFGFRAESDGAGASISTPDDLCTVTWPLALARQMVAELQEAIQEAEETIESILWVHTHSNGKGGRCDCEFCNRNRPAVEENAEEVPV